MRQAIQPIELFIVAGKLRRRQRMAAINRADFQSAKRRARRNLHKAKPAFLQRRAERLSAFARDETVAEMRNRNARRVVMLQFHAPVLQMFAVNEFDLCTRLRFDFKLRAAADFASEIEDEYSAAWQRDGKLRGARRVKRNFE